jgi:hypothetical protein
MKKKASAQKKANQGYSRFAWYAVISNGRGENADF